MCFLQTTAAQAFVQCLDVNVNAMYDKEEVLHCETRWTRALGEDVHPSVDRQSITKLPQLTKRA